MLCRTSCSIIAAFPLTHHFNEFIVHCFLLTTDNVKSTTRYILAYFKWLFPTTSIFAQNIQKYFCLSIEYTHEFVQNFEMETWSEKFPPSEPFSTYQNRNELLDAIIVVESYTH